MIIYFLILLLAIVSGILYRLGGWGNEGRIMFPYLPGWLFDSKARDLGCPLVMFFGMLLIVKVPWWVHFLSFGILFGSLTTYWDFLFGYDQMPFHGFMCGLSYFLYGFYCGWTGFIVRCITLGLIFWVIELIYLKKYNDIKDEVGRGFFLGITLLLFLI